MYILPNHILEVSSIKEKTTVDVLIHNLCSKHFEIGIHIDNTSKNHFYRINCVVEEILRKSLMKELSQFIDAFNDKNLKRMLPNELLNKIIIYKKIKEKNRKVLSNN